MILCINCSWREVQFTSLLKSIQTPFQINEQIEFAQLLEDGKSQKVGVKIIQLLPVFRFTVFC